MPVLTPCCAFKSIGFQLPLIACGLCVADTSELLATDPSIDACHLMPAAVFEVVRGELLQADMVRATQTAVGPWATSGRPLGHLWATQWCDTLGRDDVEKSFFAEYSHYIQLCVANEAPMSKKAAKKKASAGGAVTYEPSQWTVLVQSQLRRLVRSLDTVRAEQRHLTALRPLPRSFPGSSMWMKGHVVYFIGPSALLLRVSAEITVSLDEPDTSNWHCQCHHLEQVYNWLRSLA